MAHGAPLAVTMTLATQNDLSAVIGFLVDSAFKAKQDAMLTPRGLSYPEMKTIMRRRYTPVVTAILSCCTPINKTGMVWMISTTF
jgi:hypothetical protein